MSMFTPLRQRVVAWAPKRVYPLLGLMFLLLSVTFIAHAMLTVSDSGLSGDADVAVDGTGTLHIGTASSTGITIGRPGQAVTFPGSLSVAGNATTTGNLTVLGALSDAAGNRYATSTSGSNQWTGVADGISYSSGNVTIGTTCPAGSTDSVCARGNIVPGNELTAPVVSVSPQGAAGSTLWGYRVVAINATGYQTSAEATITNGVTWDNLGTDNDPAVDTGNYNRLSWTPVPNATQYLIFRSTEPAYNDTGYVGATTALEWNDTGDTQSLPQSFPAGSWNVPQVQNNSGGALFSRLTIGPASFGTLTNPYEDAWFSAFPEFVNINMNNKAQVNLIAEGDPTISTSIHSILHVMEPSAVSSISAINLELNVDANVTNPPWVINTIRIPYKASLTDGIIEGWNPNVVYSGAGSGDQIIGTVIESSASGWSA